MAGCAVQTLKPDRDPSSRTRELFASGHVIERLRYAFPIYAPQVHVDVANRELSQDTCGFRSRVNMQTDRCDGSHTEVRNPTVPSASTCVFDKLGGGCARPPFC